jgi:hypothetical protein
MGLMQKEVAELIGVSRHVYIDLETGNVQAINKRIADKLSDLYHIPPTDLLDEYGRFLYNDPAKQIKAHREKLGLDIFAFARYLGTTPYSARGWEEGTIQVAKKSWEKYLKDIL